MLVCVCVTCVQLISMVSFAMTNHDEHINAILSWSALESPWVPGWRCRLQQIRLVLVNFTLEQIHKYSILYMTCVIYNIPQMSANNSMHSLSRQQENGKMCMPSRCFAAESRSANRTTHSLCYVYHLLCKCNTKKNCWGNITTCWSGLKSYPFVYLACVLNHIYALAGWSA